LPKGARDVTIALPSPCILYLDGLSVENAIVLNVLAVGAIELAVLAFAGSRVRPVAAGLV